MTTNDLSWRIHLDGMGIWRYNLIPVQYQGQPMVISPRGTTWVEGWEYKFDDLVKCYNGELEFVDSLDEN